jgi:hypothetical protein
MTATLLLGRGVFDTAGQRHREVEVRGLDGAQELALAERWSGDDPHALEHELLAAGTARIGGYSAVDARLVAALSRGDRQLLALRLRERTAGGGLALTLRCAMPICGQLADLDLRVDDLLPDVREPEPQWISVPTREGVALVRPPSGEDERALRGVAGTRRERAAALWVRLVAAVGDVRPVTDGSWAALQVTTRHEIALGLAAAEVAPTLSFATSCPSCGAGIDVDLDAAELLLEEVRRGAGRIQAEVATLALHYGWSERDILALPRGRRWRYLELLRRQLAGMPLEGWHDA